MAQTVLKMMMAAGTAAGAGSSVEFQTIVGDATDASSYTFGSLPFGSAGDDRLVVAAIGSQRLTTNGRITAVTIGGVSATQLVSYYGAGSNGQYPFDIWAAVVPSGSTGDVAVTYTQTMVFSFASIWAVWGTSLTPYDTMVADTSGTIDTVAGGVLIAAIYGDSEPSHNLTGVTEDYDTVPTGTTYVEAGGSHSPTSTESARAVGTDDTVSFVLAVALEPA